MSMSPDDTVDMECWRCGACVSVPVKAKIKAQKIICAECETPGDAA